MAESENTTIRPPMQPVPIPTQPSAPVQVKPPVSAFKPASTVIDKTDQKQNSVLASAMAQINRLTTKFMALEAAKLVDRVKALELRIQSLEEQFNAKNEGEL